MTPLTDPVAVSLRLSAFLWGLITWDLEPGPETEFTHSVELSLVSAGAEQVDLDVFAAVRAICAAMRAER